MKTMKTMNHGHLPDSYIFARSIDNVMSGLGQGESAGRHRNVKIDNMLGGAASA